MHLQVYSAEQFKREIRRYIFFTIIISVVITTSLLYNKGLSSIIGSSILIFIIGVYSYFNIIQHNKKIKLTITEKGLGIDKQFIGRINIKGYVLEMEKRTLTIKNIVFIFQKSHHIFTINDKTEQLEKFTETLNKHISQLSDFEQSNLEKFYRKIKL